MAAWVFAHAMAVSLQLCCGFAWFFVHGVVFACGGEPTVQLALASGMWLLVVWN
ncbi:MAG: hypothetical protein AAF135_04205 [Bacteroidota bacterium]